MCASDANFYENACNSFSWMNPPYDRFIIPNARIAEDALRILQRQIRSTRQ